MKKPNNQLYFISDQYFKDFPDDKLMKNKEVIHGAPCNRPCFLALSDTKNPNISWLVPISSQTDKYQKIAQKKIAKYGDCNTIRFGTVLGRNAAFLIQNMCPATNKYLIPYANKHNQLIKIQKSIALDVIKNAQDVLVKEKHGVKLIFPDVFKNFNRLALSPQICYTERNM